MRHQRGFSLGDTLAALAVTVSLSVLMGNDAWMTSVQSSAWLDQSADLLRQARIRAVTERCPIRVSLDDLQIQLDYDDPAANCGSGGVSYANHSGAPTRRSAPELALGLGTHVRVFDPAGRLRDTDGAIATLQLDAGARRLTVDGATGVVLVQAQP